MEARFGDVRYVGIDTDAEYGYPKGAARVAFGSQRAFLAAVAARYVHINLPDVDKRVCFCWTRIELREFAFVHCTVLILLLYE